MAAPVRVNNSFGALGADPGSGGTTITFAIAPSFATLTGAQYIRLVLDANTTSFEIVHLTAYTSGATTGTMSRGQDGTTGVAHPTGNYVGPNNIVYPLGTWQCGPSKEDFNFAQMSDFVLGNNGEVMVFDSAQSNGFSNAAFGDAKQYNDLLGWSIDPVLCQNSSTIIAANIILVRIPLPRSTSVTNLIAWLGANASGTLTHSFLALFRSDGTVVGQTADQSTDWQSGGGATGIKTLALSGGPFTVAPLAANDFVWVGFYCGTASALEPAFRQALSGSTNTNLGTTASRSRSGIIAQADTATLASITPSSIFGVNLPLFAALS